MFVCTYTHKVKSYIDKMYFNRILHMDGEYDFYCVDNTPGLSYMSRLEKFEIPNLYHIDVPREPHRTNFLRNVTRSANFLRDKFLETDHEYFVIVESDVIPPRNVLELFHEAISMAKDWAVIGGLYYLGFHNFMGHGLRETHHVLSGCTVYSRDIIEIFPFRYDAKKNIGAFPDAWMSHDIKKNTGKKLYNYHKIICKHFRTPRRKRHEVQM